MSRATRVPGLLVLLAAAASVPALGQPRPPPSPRGEAPAQPPAQRSESARTATLAALDAIIAAPAEPTQATVKVMEACDGVRAVLEDRNPAAGPRAPARPVAGAADELSTWTWVCGRATKAAVVLAALGKVTTDWEKNWLPTMSTKKTRYVDLAKSLNGEYAAFQRACSARCSDKDFDAALSRFKRAVATAETLGRGVEDFRTNLEDGLKGGDPSEAHKADVADLVATLSTPPKSIKPGDAFWQHLQQWKDRVVEQHRLAHETYLKVEKEAKPVRDRTLLSGVGAPIGGVAPRDVAKTFTALQDQVTSQRDGGRAKADAEERRWDEDRQLVLQLKYPTQADLRTQKTRETELAHSAGDEPGTTKSVTSQATMEKDRLLREKVHFELKSLEQLRQENDRKIDSIVADNVRRRSLLGLPPRQLPR